jgi:hypothetical protein
MPKIIKCADCGRIRKFVKTDSRLILRYDLCERCYAKRVEANRKLLENQRNAASTQIQYTDLGTEEKDI